jgi:hypothetical protein
MGKGDLKMRCWGIFVFWHFGRLLLWEHVSIIFSSIARRRSKSQMSIVALHMHFAPVAFPFTYAKSSHVHVLLLDLQQPRSSIYHRSDHPVIICVISLVLLPARELLIIFWISSSTASQSLVSMG